ncbi:MAG: hypothetical protein M3040_08765 [Bacteroidota bacterium]|nr:hypothetical protein [Bacteroidota bacterium]
MKKQFTSRNIKAIISSVVFVLVLFSNSANAANKKAGKESAYELKYVGKFQEQPVFQLDIQNSQQEDVYITLEDEVGNLLYKDRFNQKNFSKKFQIDVSEGNGASLKMILASKGKTETQTFKINSVQKLVENVVVTRVD